SYSAPLSLLHLRFFFSTLLPPPPSSTLFPYTTLFRSELLVAPLFVGANQPHDHLAQFGTPSRIDFLRMHFGLASRTERDGRAARSEEHTSELQSQSNLVCRLLLEKKKKKK